MPKEKGKDRLCARPSLALQDCRNNRYWIGLNSTLLFLALFSSVSFGATGLVRPNPFVSSLSALIASPFQQVCLNGSSPPVGKLQVVRCRSLTVGMALDLHLHIGIGLQVIRNLVKYRIGLSGLMFDLSKSKLMFLKIMEPCSFGAVEEVVLLQGQELGGSGSGAGASSMTSTFSLPPIS